MYGSRPSATMEERVGVAIESISKKPFVSSYLAADKPHAVCVMLDSSIPGEGIATKSEVEATVKMIEFQYQQACFTNHHTKLILVCTQFGKQVARITQAYFDAKIGRLILRQSRVLELRGAETPPDAWLMLRWMVSSPVGPTQYQPPTSPPKDFREESSSRPPHITISS
ncbi:uncharacterized protein LMH87_007852 [Akanthomyces muscarius]|uniref:Uncharacterized protein n=1 Tax=Akanthomyces muscarius TaxID=2231603 RepID=A0A9W8UPS0_AKAMU|nr:uncharacterized protein LMH87_007852 [Akanthomyces muscarius]KAJ4159916.1 hypothetical protein LMH87_007852 [Akanthomyces muscarius]